MNNIAPHEEAQRLYRQGALEEAAEHYRRIVHQEPANAEALYYLARIAYQQGRFDESEQLLTKVLTIIPKSAVAYFFLGLLRHQHGDYAQALANYDRALAIKPDDVPAISNRGAVFHQLKQFNEALSSYEQALVIDPNYVDALNNRGATLLALNRLEEALTSYSQALVIQPDNIGALNNCALALHGLKRLEEALARYDRVLAISRDDVTALRGRGRVLHHLNRSEEGLVSCDRALAIKPDYFDALKVRGSILYSLNRYHEALETYARAYAISPKDLLVFTGLAHLVLRVNDFSRTAGIRKEFLNRIVNDNAIIEPFGLLGYIDDPAVQLHCAKTYVASKVPATPAIPSVGRSYRHDKPRIAYLSADFHAHATTYLMAELFEKHDRTRFDVTGISFGPDDGSAMRARIVKSFDHFHDVSRRNDREVAEFLRELEIDIAVDLKGHTKDSRVPILAHRPAPIQVNYLGYPGTMGADFIDYIIADEVVLPFSDQKFFTEAIVHLPGSYQVNDSKRAIADTTASRKDLGLPETGFVFCCFNISYKITESFFDIWMRLLDAIDGSVLWLYRHNDASGQNLRQAAQMRGINPERLVFANTLDIPEHLARYRLADLFLDTLPINAHTTARDALWAGLPVLTCRGRSFAGRVAASLLQAIGLSDLVTGNLEDYESLALRLAREPSLLEHYKVLLARNRTTSALFDAGQFSRHLEQAYCTMLEIHRRGEPPHSFTVSGL